MPPKKATGATKKATPAAHASYRGMFLLILNDHPIA
jgi:hypothetical protein